MKTKQLLGGDEISKALSQLAGSIYDSGLRPADTVLVGILTRGVAIAHRIARLMHDEHSIRFKVGILDTRPFRDDLKGEESNDRTNLGFSIDDKNVILVDDVISSGRTIRAALDGLIKNGRPKRIITAVLIDRGHREFPINADHVGTRIPTSIKEKVKVRLSDIDGGRDRAFVRLNR